MISVARSPINSGTGQNGRPFRVGFVPLTDAAPLIAAKEEGIFEKHGVQVDLIPVPGWVSIREQLITGELDAAHCLTGLDLTLQLGVNCTPVGLVVPMFLSVNGNAITLSKAISPDVLKKQGGLKEHVLQTNKKGRPFTIASVHRCSTNYVLLHDWLIREGLRPLQDVAIAFLPPATLLRNLKTGAIDGYCSEEPWNSRAILEGTGWCVATSCDLANDHPNKSLAIRQEILEQRPEAVVALTRALLEAAALCDTPSYRESLCSILGRWEYLNTTEAIIGNGLLGAFDTGTGARRKLPHFIRFSGRGVSAPTRDKIEWLLSGMRQTKILEGHKSTGLSALYRDDLFRSAAETQTGSSNCSSLSPNPTQT